MEKVPKKVSERLLFLGGARSGKSRAAEIAAENSDRSLAYLATAQIHDDEMSARVSAHKMRRSERWNTLEVALDVTEALEALTASDLVLIDCATLWLSNVMLAERPVEPAIDAFVDGIAKSAADVIVVSNEVGQGIVPDHPLGRAFRDAQGLLNQRLAAACDTAVLVVAGLPVVLKGTMPRGLG